MNQESKTINRMRDDAKGIFHAGLCAVEPERAVKKFCGVENGRLFVGDRSYDLSRKNNLFVIGAGKASAPMAAALEELLGERIGSGVVNVKYGHTAPLNRIKLIEAGHPTPDANGESGARAMLDLAKGAQPDDLVICVLSGGGSALLPLAAEGLTLTDKQEMIEVLLSCGATIHEINAVRKHVSSIKGGHLARAVYPAELISLILSDVVGDDLDVIASGPTVPDTSSFSDCMNIFKKYAIADQLPKSVLRHIQSGIAGKIPETPRIGDPVFARSHNQIIGSNIEAVLSARKFAEKIGYRTIVLSSMIEGETRHVASVHGAIAREIVKTGHPANKPACVLSGGETTVTIKGNGLGGRNQEFSLAAAIDIAGADRIVVLSAGTDGTDGPTDAAGAVADSRTCERALSAGMDPIKYLNRNDAYHFFEKLSDLFITGPTRTNVMDLRIMLIS